MRKFQRPLIIVQSAIVNELVLERHSRFSEARVVDNLVLKGVRSACRVVTGRHVERTIAAKPHFQQLAIYAVHFADNGGMSFSQGTSPFGMPVRANLQRRTPSVPSDRGEGAPKSREIGSDARRARVAARRLP